MSRIPLTVIAKIRAKKGKEDVVREVLRGLLVPTRNEKGCLNYDLHEVLETPGLFYFYENWTDGAALEQHLKSNHVQSMIRQAETLFAETPEILRLEAVQA